MLAIAHTTAYDSALTVLRRSPSSGLAGLSMPVLVLRGRATFR